MPNIRAYNTSAVQHILMPQYTNNSFGDRCFVAAGPAANPSTAV